ncbi:MAG: hypothetical protein UX78_C0005G0022 [Candidatus Amesbacteria bacterium GW2011_GWA2_47_11]|uniref:ADP-dependent (S)-NAD(P)H-hydrate dehydratase n=2 Tax=Candidatus Amesiibacteriota TaxID=1752730 RepID=A0A0G1RHK6_9BACT|nr:MAG: hypothetical protein UX78_C0005G0022 [Candidatus Amesbacteria bacterium GW2011_GWA2_47_11]KKW00139.1 MAG: hypothetical protein UY33_C0015G0026 [Candidatus Amesbacteria bacterium GW2011_GWA1_48_9]OGC99349.1 MAG: hypothetical protein A2702_03065 [Candidatus Amesbacteria bacterium RIFCSPHIGHO2_01_FULL_48_75]OGD05307.1 MAG: hypothetical protein A3B58_01490 [Candidatus Amesbacteria bacterium RIFCSPLOWO2_01_FULL_48_50]
MMAQVSFDGRNLKELWKPQENSYGEDNGQITIIGGSDLFTGAPLLSLVAASRLVDMVFLATPDEDKTVAAKMKLFSKLKSVIWVPREEIEKYIEKSDAVLIGPGLMRYQREGGSEVEIENTKIYDKAGTETKMLTHYLLSKFPRKQWVIDGGSLQVMDPKWIPKGAILTPNKWEFEKLLGEGRAHEWRSAGEVAQEAREYRCVIAYKVPQAIVSNGEVTYEISGGNAGLTKGGTGDVLAGVIAGLAAKNPPLLAAAAGIWLVKKTADLLYEKVGYAFNADDLAEKVFETYRRFVVS